MQLVVSTGTKWFYDGSGTRGALRRRLGIVSVKVVVFTDELSR